MAGGKGRKPTQPAAAAGSGGSPWTWLWALVYAAGAALGLLVAFMVYCSLKSRWCFKRKSGRQQPRATGGRSPEEPGAAPVRLYWAEVHQDSHIVHCCLQEKGVAFEKTELDAGHFGRYDHLRADILALCPNGSLPFIVHEGCPVVGNAWEIVDYIDRAFEGPPLVPRDGDRLADMQALMQIIREDMGRPVAVLLSPVSAVFQKYMSLPGVLGALWRHPNPAVYLSTLFSILMGSSGSSLSQDFVTQSFARLNSALDKLEKRFEDGREHLLGEFSLVDIAMMPELSRLDQLGLLDMLLEPAGGECRSGVRAYWARLSARESFEPSFQQAKGAGAVELRDWLARFREDIRERGPVAVYLDDEGRGPGGSAADDEDEEET